MRITEKDSNNKILLVGGCSFLERPWDEETPNKARRTSIRTHVWKNLSQAEIDNLRFTALLAKKLKRKEVSMAKSGNNNKRFLEQITDYIIDNPDKDIEVIIGLTELSRFYIPHPHSNRLDLNISINSVDFFLDSESFTEYFDFISREQMKEYIETYYKYLYNDDRAVLELKRLLLYFDAFCKQRGVNTTYFLAYDGQKHIAGKLYENIVTKTDLTFFNFLSQEKKLISWRDYIGSYDRRYQGNHPNAYDNRKLADMFEVFLKKNG